MGATILVVDDESAVRTLMRVVLEYAGYSVLVAADGEEGLHVFRQYHDRIALLLTDVAMPRMSGFDLADHVLESDSQIPVVFTSGTVLNADRGFGCIAKPFKPAELIGRVHEVLEERESRGKLRDASLAARPHGGSGVPQGQRSRNSPGWRARPVISTDPWSDRLLKTK